MNFGKARNLFLTAPNVPSSVSEAMSVPLLSDSCSKALQVAAAAACAEAFQLIKFPYDPFFIVDSHDV